MTLPVFVTTYTWVEVITGSLVTLPAVSARHSGLLDWVSSATSWLLLLLAGMKYTNVVGNDTRIEFALRVICHMYYFKSFEVDA